MYDSEAVQLSGNFPKLSGTLKELPPVDLQLVSESELEPWWDELVHTFHYLGCRRLLGRRLKNMAFLQGHPVAALAWSATARKLKVRDEFIGWSDAQRKQYLCRLAANSRFVIFPWVQIPHLASHLLGQNLRRLTNDWHGRYLEHLLMVENFVDPSLFSGTVYKASNWRYLGSTQGSTKLGKGYVYHVYIKDVFVYVFEPRFRDILGISSTSPHLIRPLPRKVEELSMILHNLAWDPDPQTQTQMQMQIDEEDLQHMAQELTDFHHEFHSCFARCEQERLGLG